MPRLVDLTVEQFEGNTTHPAHGRTPLIFKGPVSHGITAQRRIPNPYDGSPVSAANEYILITGHTGTHVDAPCHVDHKSPISVERIPIERASGPALWLDLSEHCRADAAIGAEHLAAAERDSGEQIRPQDIVLIHTGWHDIEDSDMDSLHGPYLVRESAEWLRERGIKALGIDMASPEGACAMDLPIHMNFLRPRSMGLDDSEYILIYENLRGISEIEHRRFSFLGLPIPFRGATGAPVRAVAEVTRP